MNENLPIYYVYMFIDPRTNTPIYIGKGKHKRYEQHFDSRSLFDNTLFHNYLRKMLREKVSPIIEFVEEGLTSEEALRLEIIIIAKYGRLKTNTGPLLNLTDGGEGTAGIIHSDEFREKARKRQLGKRLSEEKIKKILQNRKYTPTQEFLDQRRKYMQEKWGNKVYCYCLHTGKLLKIYPSLRSVAKDGYSVSRVSDVCKLVYPQHRRRGWTYYWKKEWGNEEDHINK